MRKIWFIALFLVSACCLGQQAETARFELPRLGKDQDCHFESFKETGGIMVYETDQIDEDKNQLWNFITLDTNLYEKRSDLIPLPQKLRFFDSKSSSQWAVFLFLNEKQQKSDSVGFFVVAFRRDEQKFSTFQDRLPERSVLQSIALLDGTLMLSVNGKAGNGFIAQYDLNTNRRRTITPSLGSDFILFQFVADTTEEVFVAAAREYVDKHYKATSFLLYSKDGAMLGKHRYENGENAALGRMCFAFDENHQLIVISTLEREGDKKVSLEGVTEDFSKISVGVTWICFASGGTVSKSYLFKNLPDIEKALTPSDRIRLRSELLRLNEGKKKERSEIAFQFMSPRLVRFGERWVFAAEAFQPIYHTETRMQYGYFGSYPVTYTVFDGYDFFSEILLAFDGEGDLQWQRSVRFENELCDVLREHAMEVVSQDELLVVSPSMNTLRYEVFGQDGTPLLDQHVMQLDFLFGMDSCEDEYDAGLSPWYGNRFLTHGCQIVRNDQMRNTRRVVFYLQKVQYE